MLLCWSINLCMNELRGNTRHISFAWRRVRVSLAHIHKHTHTHGSSSHLSPVAGPCSHSTLFPLIRRHTSYLKNDCFLAHPWNLPLTIMCSLILMILIWCLVSNSSVWVTRLRERERGGRHYTWQRVRVGNSNGINTAMWKVPHK